MAAFVINGAFRAQRVTGQQRYATEVANRLLANASAREVAPHPRVAASSLMSWGWTQTLAGRRPRTPLLSLTSRAPVTHPRHCVVVHDLFVLTNPEWFSRSYVASHAPLLRAHVKRAELVFAVSPATANRVREVFGIDQIVIAPNAPSSVFLDDAGSSAKIPLRWGLRAQGYLLAVGSLDPRKNYLRLLEAHKNLTEEVQQNFPLVITGGAASIYANQPTAGSGSARFTGYVSDAELAALYQHAAGVVLGSLDEGFGLPAVEALAAGANLAVSDIEVFRWVCGEHALYFNPNDTVSIAASLTRLIEAPAPTAGILAKRRAAAKRFSWDNTAARISMKIAAL